MNIRKKYSSIYKDFFTENNLVLSTYFSFSWTTNGIGNFSRIPRIRQKLDYKMYVGINKIEKNKIIFNEIKFYDYSLGKFEKENFEDIFRKHLELKDFLEKEIIGEKFGYEINILSEAPRGYTLGFSGTLGSLIISGMNIFLKKINKKIFEEDILKNKNIFEELRKKAFEFELIAKNKNTAGDASFMCFVNSKNPISYNIDNGLLNYKSLDLLKNEKFNLEYIVIYSGLRVNADRIEKQILNGKNKILKIEKELLGNNFLVENGHLKNILEKNKTYNYLNNVLIILNGFLIYYLNKIIKTEENIYIEGFLENINKIRFSLNIFEKQIDFAEKFSYIFENLKNYDNSKIGISSGTSSKNGGTYIAFYKEKDKKSILETIRKIKKFYPNSKILFSTGNNINKNYGIEIEQFLSQKVYGTFSNKKGVLLMEKGITKIIDYKNLEKLNYDILIDSIKNKIYIGGEKLTSKNIHSQSIATEILVKIVKNENYGEIKNSEISFGSYRENKIELNGKVILPLNKVILNKLNYLFPLNISGNIRNYVIKLEKHNLKIAIIKKINFL